MGKFKVRIFSSVTEKGLKIMVLGLSKSFSTKPESTSTKPFFSSLKGCNFALFRMVKNKLIEKEEIFTGIYLPGEIDKSSFEVKISADNDEKGKLVYTENEIQEEWGNVHLQIWKMPGFCMISLVSQLNSDVNPELKILGGHISIISRIKGSTYQGIDKNLSLGLVKIKSSENETLELSDGGNKFLIMILSKPFFTKLLLHESWTKKVSYQEKVLLDNGKDHQYFLEKPIKNIFDDILEEDISIGKNRYYLELKLKELFYLLHLLPEISGLESPLTEEVQNKLVEAKAYILSNYHTSPTIKQLSRIVSLNEFKLKLYFKLLFGTSIRSYLINIRMEEAKSLLKENYSVHDVCAQLGYRNVSHFILIFKRTFGVTPGQMMNR